MLCGGLRRIGYACVSETFGGERWVLTMKRMGRPGWESDSYVLAGGCTFMYSGLRTRKGCGPILHVL